jgi:hypothetical protein
MEFMFHATHAPMKTVYTRLAHQSRNLRFGWIALQPTRCHLKYQAGVEPVAGVESKPRQDIIPTPDADPLLGSVASEVVRYLASFAMTAVATVVAVGVDSTLTIPNLSLVFVVPVIIAGVSLGLGRRFFRRYLVLSPSISSLLSLATHSPSTIRQTFGRSGCCLSSDSS